MVPFRHGVSIHALLAECDHSRRRIIALLYSFNPRTPCGVRRLIVHGRLFYTGFQSTHSLRSATVSAKSTRERMPVSIHALLAECDKTKTKRKEIKQCFNPRTPCGVRHEHEIHEHVSIQFQSTHSLRSATAAKWAFNLVPIVSIHALLAECDMRDLAAAVDGGNVSIHALLAECDNHEQSNQIK